MEYFDNFKTKLYVEIFEKHYKVNIGAEFSLKTVLKNT